ncbi:MAG: 4'-phosphopantetheinyl transferase superfamily protein [bacterium]|nr:4'-phosphopantetheinyl transferase superfamily protein [bacterium]
MKIKTQIAECKKEVADMTPCPPSASFPCPSEQRGSISQQKETNMLEVFAVKIPEVMDDNLFEALLTYVSPDKETRIRRFRRKEDRIRGLISDLLIRSIVMSKTGLKNRNIEFGTNEYGKPNLKGWNNFHFNLSHSGMWVVAAVDNRPVGIDVEKVGDIDLAISENFFSDDEHNDLMRQHDKLSYFFTLWTLKESYIKNIGRGLSMPLKSFSVRYFSENEITISSEGKELDDVRFTSYNIHRDYKLMLCATHDRLPEEVNMHTPENLITDFLRVA